MTPDVLGGMVSDVPGDLQNDIFSDPIDVKSETGGGLDTNAELLNFDFDLLKYANVESGDLASSISTQPASVSGTVNYATQSLINSATTTTTSSQASDHNQQILIAAAKLQAAAQAQQQRVALQRQQQQQVQPVTLQPVVSPPPQQVPSSPPAAAATVLSIAPTTTTTLTTSQPKLLAQELLQAQQQLSTQRATIQTQSVSTPQTIQVQLQPAPAAIPQRKIILGSQPQQIIIQNGQPQPQQMVQTNLGQLSLQQLQQVQHSGHQVIVVLGFL